MALENEAKFFIEDVASLREFIAALNPLEHKSRQLMKRWIFDFPDLRLDSSRAWIRLRQEQERTTLCYKQRLSSEMGGTVEYEIAVDDRATCINILNSIGLTLKTYQETWREAWFLENGVMITIDEWPWIAPICEIEAPSESLVWETVSRIGMSPSACITDSTEYMYLLAFELPDTMENRTAVSTIPYQAFDSEPPDFLRVRQAKE